MNGFEKIMIFAFAVISLYIWYSSDSWKATLGIFIALLIIYYLSRPKIKKYKREAIPESVKQEVWKRQGYTCACCPENRLDAIEFHHKVPSSQGGSSIDQNNIIGLCGVCHSMKTRFDQKTGAYRK